VRTSEFCEDPGSVARVGCEIWVDKESHKAIVIGAKGASLKKIGTESRAEIERLLGRQVFLDLRVVAKPGWATNPRWMKELGYVVAE
jgi:GTP-binding protein Era